ncbi:uncharacterized protein Gasu_54640 [Galdieria sulphuraria]|uniref:Uncharacterized protein n=1 Tax=Galdieria sulphuraria TaxID=130081 RepID=M2XU07_GALSU|nr:uncharacterized protein Gasu_54640 [Galdieria sulphuraria]EME26889.1 hypothetical protein Gasu_54640 [Galdieria sulphuraria]|eukprot:XP_005703409.1 hypothetical protein Gasu_54640 [Galdieria sulphuraria]
MVLVISSEYVSETCVEALPGVVQRIRQKKNSIAGYSNKSTKVFTIQRCKLTPFKVLKSVYLGHTFVG